MTKTNHTPLRQYSEQILELIQKSISEVNPALFLLKQDARTPLFMAESITRLLAVIPDGEEMAKAEKKIKKLEDSIGEIDDYDQLFTLFSKNKNIAKAQLNYFLEKGGKSVIKLNARLIKKDFYQELFNKLSRKISVDFNNKVLIKSLEKQIAKELADCYDFFRKYADGFTDMEEQVHEIRRKLRWISIYAQSFKGSIVLDPSKKKYAWEKKFITAAELKSPYNKVPVNKNLEVCIHFNKKAFLALSFVVTALGKIKDKGLQWEALGKSAKKTSELSNDEATELASKQLKLKYSEEDLFKEAHILLEEFFNKHRIHELLFVK